MAKKNREYGISNKQMIRKYCSQCENRYFSADDLLEDWITLWNSINKEPEKQWDANPYVFVYEFERVEKPEVMA